MSQEVPILFRVKTDVQTAAVLQAFQLEVTENGMIDRRMVCCRKSWEAPPPLQTSQMKRASPRPILFLFLCELETLRGVLCALTVLLWTFILDRYHRWWHHQEAGVSLCPNTRFMSDLTSSALEYVSGTLLLWTKKMCPTSCLCRERHGNHARHPDEFKREEQQQKRKWEFWVPIETWQRLGLICSYVLYVQLLHVHRCTPLHSSDKLYWHQTAADQW